MPRKIPSYKNTHYRAWMPERMHLKMGECESGKPVLSTEWYSHNRNQHAAR